MTILLNKKIIGFIFLLGLWITPTMACKVIDFYNQNNSYVGDDICIDIDKLGTSRFKLNLVERNSTGSDLRCMLLIGSNNLLQDVGACDQEFSYGGQDQSKIKIYARLGTGLWGNSEGYYDFYNGKWTTYQYDDSYYNTYTTTSLDNFSISSSENANGWYNLYIKARDDTNSLLDTYYGTIRFRVYKRTSASATWSEITSSSSTYYEINPSYYEFTSSDYGDKDFYNFIKFSNYDYDYKLEVYDEDYTSKKGEKIFYVKGSDTISTDQEVDNFSIVSNPSSPSINLWTDLTIKSRNSYNTTLTEYSGSIRFKVYKKSSSSSWSEITSSESSYYTLDRTSYTFTAFDDGQVTLNDTIKFNNRNYDYKVRVYDYEDNAIYGEKIFYFIDDLSNFTSDGFSPSEITKIQKVYNVRKIVINNIGNKYSTLKNSSNRQNLSDNFYKNMEYLLEDSSSSEFGSYNDFLNGFMDWYEYTVERM